MSGLALFGVSQLTTVKADTVNSMSPVSQSISKSDSTGQSQADTESGDSSVTPAGSENKTESDGQASSTDEKDTSGQSDSGSNSRAGEQPNAELNDNNEIKGEIPTDPTDIENGDTQQPNQAATKSDPSLTVDKSQESNGSDDVVASDQNQEKESDGSDMHTDNSLGVPWSIKGTVLNIEGGTLNDITRDSNNDPIVPWTPSERNSITEVSINGDLIAGKSLSGLFSNFESVTKFDGLKNIHTQNTIDMSDLFGGCGDLESLNLNGWDVSKVQNFRSMFYYDSSLTTVDISEWDWSDGIDFQAMFSFDSKLQKVKLPINHVNSVNVKDRSKLNFSFMFSTSFGDAKSGNPISLDVSNIDMSGSQNVHFFLQNDNNMNEVTLSDNNILYNGLEDAQKEGSVLEIYGPAIGNTKPVAWQAIKSNDNNIPVGTIKTPKQLVKMYSGNFDKNSSITWKWFYAVPSINFQVEYVAEDDPTKSFSPGITYSTDSYKEYDGIPPLSSYTLPEGVSFDGYYTDYKPEIIPTSADANGIIKIKVPKNQITFEVIEKNTDGVTIGGKSHIIFKGVGPKYNESNLADELKKISDDRKIITSDDKATSYSQFSYGTFGGDLVTEDLSDSMISDISKGSTEDSQAFIKGFVSGMVPGSTEDLESMSGTKFVITLVYSPEPGDAPVINNNGNSSSSSSSNSSEENRTIEGIEETLGTYNDRSEVQLYDDEGSQLTDRKLAPSSDWFTDETMTLNNDKYYRVATNEWAKADDVYIYYNHDSDVLVNTGSVASLVTADGKNVTDRALQANSRWYTDRYIYINNDKYYRVATNEFVSADKVQEY